MNRNPPSLAETEFDLLIVGGGIFGVCAAWEAASRGLSVALIERRDFSHATSANHFKMIHGGIRYLQHADLRRARESSRERSALLRVAPHLSSPLPIVIPSYGRGSRGRAILRLGFSAFDLLTLDRNRGLEGIDQRIPRSGFLRREEVLAEFPGLPKQALTGGAVFFDGQVYSPPRLAVAFLRSAVAIGAQAANYLEANSFLVTGDRVSGVRAIDSRTGQLLNIRAQVVLNAAGPWAAGLLETLGNSSAAIFPKGRPVFSRDVALVVNRRPPSTRYGVAITTGTRDADALLDRGGRHLFLLPWRGRTLVGVWHSVHSGETDDVAVPFAELSEYVAEINSVLPGLDLSVRDVSAVNSGLTLFEGHDPETGLHRFGKRSMLVDHETQGLPGLITLVGVRATMARGTAERAVDLVVHKLGRPRVRSRTVTQPIFGGEVSDRATLRSEIQARVPQLSPEVVDGLARNYGSRYADVLDLGRSDPALLETLGGGTVLAAEVVHAVEREMALDLEDVVLRRTDLGSAGDPGDAVLLSCARVMGGLLGWTDEVRTQQLERMRRRMAVPTATEG